MDRNGWVVGYAWLLVEGSPDTTPGWPALAHHYPPYQLWRLALPDFKHVSTGAWILEASWLAVLGALAIRSWRSPPAAHAAARQPPTHDGAQTSCRIR